MDQNYSILIKPELEISFDHVSLSSQDFSLLSDGSREYQSKDFYNPTWSLIDTQNLGSNIKIQGRFKPNNAPSDGWSINVLLNPPENTSGTYGTSTGEQVLSDLVKDFVTNIPVGVTANLQTQVFKIHATSEAWQTATSVGSESFILEWTIVEDFSIETLIQQLLPLVF